MGSVPGLGTVVCHGHGQNTKAKKIQTKNHLENELCVMCTLWVVFAELFLPLLPLSETNPVWTANSSWTSSYKRQLSKKEKKKVSVSFVEFTFMEEFVGIHQFYLSLIVLASVKLLLPLEISPHEKKTMFFKALVNQCRDWGFWNTLSLCRDAGGTQ